LQKATEVLTPCSVSVRVRDKDWIETQKMNAFLNVAKGSCEPPLFIEINYCGGSPMDKPVLLVGE
jgi:aminopeptidase